MSHESIEHELVIERYVTGQLASDELERFEEHYLACGRCLEELAMAGGLARGLKQLAAAETARAVAALGLVARLRRHAALVAVALLFVVSGSFYLGLASLRNELGKTRTSLAEAFEGVLEAP